jgi:hypothetical protein
MLICSPLFVGSNMQDFCFSVISLRSDDLVVDASKYRSRSVWCVVRIHFDFTV